MQNNLLDSKRSIIKFNYLRLRFREHSKSNFLNNVQRLFEGYRKSFISIFFFLRKQSVIRWKDICENINRKMKLHEIDKLIAISCTTFSYDQYQMWDNYKSEYINIHIYIYILM